MYVINGIRAKRKALEANKVCSVGYIFDGVKTTLINEIVEIIVKINPKVNKNLSDFRSRFCQEIIKKNKYERENIVKEIENRIKDGKFDSLE